MELMFIDIISLVNGSILGDCFTKALNIGCVQFHSRNPRDLRVGFHNH